MATLDSLPDDQRAVLELVLRRARSYDQIAQLLSIDRAGVRERALGAFDALGPQTRVAPERRALITDYLLGQLPERVAHDVREHLAQSASERAWARVVASELQPIVTDPLPEIPVEPSAAPEEAAPEPEPELRSPRPISRRGGAILLGLGAAAIVAVVIVLIVTSGGGSKHRPSTAASATTPAASTSSTGSTTPTPVAQINLVPPAAGSKAAGIALVVRQGGNLGLVIRAQGLAPNSKHPPDAYAVWLYNAPTDSRRLGFVSPGVGSNGQLTTAGGLPPNASHYKQLLVTLETQTNPSTPGRIVLQGALSGV